MLPCYQPRLFFIYFSCGLPSSHAAMCYEWTKMAEASQL